MSSGTAVSFIPGDANGILLQLSPEAFLFVKVFFRLDRFAFLLVRMSPNTECPKGRGVKTNCLGAVRNGLVPLVLQGVRKFPIAIRVRKSFRARFEPNGLGIIRDALVELGIDHVRGRSQNVPLG